MGKAKILCGLVLVLFAGTSGIRAQDPGWPRRNVQPGGTLIPYQPQVEELQATRIPFDKDDLQTAEMIQAGPAPKRAG